MRYRGHKAEEDLFSTDEITEYNIQMHMLVKKLTVTNHI